MRNIAKYSSWRLRYGIPMNLAFEAGFGSASLEKLQKLQTNLKAVTPKEEVQALADQIF